MQLIGIDVGNYATKSANTSTVSGYEGPFSEKPSISKDFLFYDGGYYTPSNTRLFYSQDKTVDERGIVLTLFAIAKELLFRISQETTDSTEIQRKINEVNEIALGCGLPIGHYQKKYVTKLLDYYNKFMNKGVNFVYNDFNFDFIMKECRVYPQGGAAAMLDNNPYISVYNEYYVVDIGGYTVDVAQFKDDAIAVESVFSLEQGMITLFDEITGAVFKECDLSIDSDTAESVLLGKRTILPKKAIDIIHSFAEKHAHNILNGLRQNKIMFDSRPCLFVGGGSQVLQEYLLESSLVNKEHVHFINDINANAKGYERLLSAELRL